MVDEVLSPLPGTIVKILPKIGEKVDRDAVLMILEAMKMENEIRASTEGKIIEIAVEEGDKVREGDLLLKIER